MPDGAPDAAHAPHAVFRHTRGPAAGREIAIPGPSATIGQGPRQDVVLEDDTVSTQHARLEFREGGWWLTDLGSRNGTFLDDRRLDPQAAAPVPDGSVLRFGGVHLEFEQRSRQPAGPAGPRTEAPSPSAPARSAEHPTGLRLPVWVLLLVVLAIAMAVGIFVLVGGQPAVEPPPVDAVSGLTGGAPPCLAA